MSEKISGIPNYVVYPIATFMGLTVSFVIALVVSIFPCGAVTSILLALNHFGITNIGNFWLFAPWLAEFIILFVSYFTGIMSKVINDNFPPTQ